MSKSVVSLTVILRQRLADSPLDGPRKPDEIKTIAEGLVEELLIRAGVWDGTKKDVAAIKEIWDRIDGVQSKQLTSTLLADKVSHGHT